MRQFRLSMGALLLAGCFFHSAELEPEAAGVDFAVQGEYRSPGAPIAAQVIALGDGDFRMVRLEGGLPGAGWDGRSRRETDGRREGDQVVFEDRSTIRNGVLTLGSTGTSSSPISLSLSRVERVSPTLGAPAPPGAVVIFDAGLDAVEGRRDERGLLEVGATSRDSFGDVHLHLEFRTPFMPTARGQARGNSGIYLQNRYEVQILDSFGLTGEWDECGGIYKVSKPAVHMAFPPLAWQTYDIDFTAARFDSGGNKISPARLSVQHNGVLIHDDVALPDRTGGGDREGPEPGPLHLQDHWNPVFFRNIWLIDRQVASPTH